MTNYFVLYMHVEIKVKHPCKTLAWKEAITMKPK